VWNEVVVKGAGRSGSVKTAQASWIHGCVAGEPDSALDLAHAIQPWWRRSSTILLAMELSAGLALVDERKARTVAANKGLTLSGSIAALEQGYRVNQVPDLRQTYLDLLAAKIWIDRKTLIKAWPASDYCLFDLVPAV